MVKKLVKVKDHQRLIGSLQYATLTHSDIQCHFNKLSQFLIAPKKIHWLALKPFVTIFVVNSECWNLDTTNQGLRNYNLL